MADIHQIRSIAGNILQETATENELEVFKQYLASRDEQAVLEEIIVPDAFPQPKQAVLLTEEEKQLMLQHILAQKPVLKKGKLVRMRRIMTGVAASLLLCVGAYTTWRYINDVSARPVYTDVFAAYGQHKVVLMPDSSRVVLNAGSHMRYAYKDEMREVFLEGEAFFEVTPNPQRAFIVHSSRLATRVLGTSFNVRAYEKDSFISVQVKTGKVKVSLNDSTAAGTAGEVILLPSRQAVFKEGTNSLSVQEVNIADIAGWTSHKLIFNDQPAAVILNELERIYNIRFSPVKASAMTRRYTMRLKKMPLAHTLETVGALTGLRFQVKDSIVVVH